MRASIDIYLADIYSYLFKFHLFIYFKNVLYNNENKYNYKYINPSICLST